jgi:hypothetical protein
VNNTRRIRRVGLSQTKRFSPNFLLTVVFAIARERSRTRSPRAAPLLPAAARWASYIKNLNHSLAALDARAAGAAYNFPPYMAAPPPMQVQQYPYGGYPLAAYPNAGYPNATGYGVNSYGASPLSGVMGSLLGPMLGSGQIP